MSNIVGQGFFDIVKLGKNRHKIGYYAPFTVFRCSLLADFQHAVFQKFRVFLTGNIKIAFSILNARYLMNKPTIISSEWDLINQLLPADEGVFSRVYERCKRYRVMIPRNAGNNFRLTQKGA